jgi:hypothetical protein
MADPAASSAARVIRFPEDRRAMELSISLWTLSRLLLAFIAATFVLIDVIFLLLYLNYWLLILL